MKGLIRSNIKEEGLGTDLEVGVSTKRNKYNGERYIISGVTQVGMTRGMVNNNTIANYFRPVLQRIYTVIDCMDDGMNVLYGMDNILEDVIKYIVQYKQEGVSVRLYIKNEYAYNVISGKVIANEEGKYYKVLESIKSSIALIENILGCEVYVYRAMTGEFKEMEKVVRDNESLGEVKGVRADNTGEYDLDKLSEILGKDVAYGIVKGKGVEVDLFAAEEEKARKDLERNSRLLGVDVSTGGSKGKVKPSKVSIERFEI